jgi:hypothetical protein
MPVGAQGDEVEVPNGMRRAGVVDAALWWEGSIMWAAADGARQGWRGFWAVHRGYAMRCGGGDGRSCVSSLIFRSQFCGVINGCSYGTKLMQIGAIMGQILSKSNRWFQMRLTASVRSDHMFPIGPRQIVFTQCIPLQPLACYVLDNCWP